MAHGERLCHRVVAGDGDRALARVDKGREHFEHRGLAGAVGADKADDLVFVDLEADLVDGG